MGYWDKEVDTSILVGKTLERIENKDNEKLIFVTDDKTSYLMFHDQDCCENVEIEDICGDLDDLIGSPILQAETVTSENETPDGCSEPGHDDSFAWTFYKFSTTKGSVTIRWFGTSNGYYSESVSFVEQIVQQST